METDHPRSQRNLSVQKALLRCADFLSFYKELANAHPVDFIVCDLWDRVLPGNIQEELSALTKKDLYKLPSHRHLLPRCGKQSTNKETSPAEAVCDELAFGVGEIKIKTQNGSFSGDFLCSTTRDTPWDWKHGSLQDFLTAVQECCIENLHCLTTSKQDLISWLQDENGSKSPAAPFVHAFMKEKKMHEVEIMGDVCTRIFHKSDADVVIDLGSGKGYLSTHLTLQCGLPVVGIDSQSHNTSGAARRAEKLGRQWEALVKNEEKKSQAVPDLATQSEVKGESGAFPSGSNEENKRTVHSGTETVSKLCEDQSLIMDCGLHKIQDRTLNGGPSLCHAMKEESKQNAQKTESSDENQMGKSNSATVEYKDDTSKMKQMSEAVHENQIKDKAKSPDIRRCVAVTTFVNPATRLTDFVTESADLLRPKKAHKDLRLFLTGLHTCGPLAASMLRLFVKDDATQAMCGVGCCYQLMQENFGDIATCGSDPQRLKDTEADSPNSGHVEGDFPLSAVLLEKKMSIGRTALNMASLALLRMSQEGGQLQGKTFYPRALLQAFILKKLGYIPQDLKKLRKLAKQASNPVDYVVKAMRKLNITSCEVSEEEVIAFHQQHQHQEEKMAAFFQLRAALAPVVETVVLLDRLLFLLEQDCVEKVFLVQLFDPVTSPRCHALIALKKRT